MFVAVPRALLRYNRRMKLGPLLALLAVMPLVMAAKKKKEPKPDKK